MKDVEAKTLIWTSYLRFIATIEIAITSTSQIRPEKYEGLDEMLRSMASHLNRKQNRELDSFISKFIQMLQGALDSHEPMEQILSFSEIKDPLVRAAAIQFTNKTIEAAARDADRFHLEAAAVSLVSAFELFCTDLAHQIFRAHPEAIPGNPSVTLAKISQSSSIDSIIDSTAYEKARELLMGPADEWLSKLASHCKLALPSRIEDWPEEIRDLCWFAACRNSIVHIGGKVDDKLINRALKLRIMDTDLPVTISFTPKDIVHNALNMAKVATSLTSGLRINLTNKESRGEEQLGNKKAIAQLQLSVAERGHAQLAEALGTPGRDDSPTKEVTFSQIAHWTAMTSAGKTIEVNRLAKESNWADNSVARLHKAVLTGELESIDEVIQSALEDGLTLVDVLYDPQFQLVRKHLN